jgi:hypothetical protein
MDIAMLSTFDDFQNLIFWGPGTDVGISKMFLPKMAFSFKTVRMLEKIGSEHAFKDANFCQKLAKNAEI